MVPQAVLRGAVEYFGVRLSSGAGRDKPAAASPPSFWPAFVGKSIKAVC